MNSLSIEKSRSFRNKIAHNTHPRLYPEPTSFLQLHCRTWLFQSLFYVLEKRICMKPKGIYAVGAAQSPLMNQPSTIPLVAVLIYGHRKAGCTRNRPYPFSLCTCLLSCLPTCQAFVCTLVPDKYIVLTGMAQLGSPEALYGRAPQFISTPKLSTSATN